MNKADLVGKIAESAGVSKAVATKTLAAFTSNITKELKKGEKVTLVGFGTFSVSKRKARNGVNPQTKEKIKIKARKVPKFTCGKALKEAVK